MPDEALQPRRLLIPGIAFDFGGGQVYTVPPLSTGALELLQDRLNALQNLQPTDPAVVATIVDATLMALARNYPAATRAQVGELVDLGNMFQVFECLMDVGGVKRRAEAGNPQAPAPAGMAGAASTPESPPTPAGPSSTSEST